MLNILRKKLDEKTQRGEQEQGKLKQFIGDENLRLQRVSGMKHDAMSCMENGAVAYPIKNFRWNENPLMALKNMEMRGRLVRIGGTLLPHLKVKEFTFSSLSNNI